MERLTEIIDGIVCSTERYIKHSPCHHCKYQSTDKCLENNCTYGSALNRLAAYEDTDLTPKEIHALRDDRDYWEREAKKWCSKLGEIRLYAEIHRRDT